MAQAASALELSSTAFKQGEKIPSKYTCDAQGGGVNPALNFSGIPANAKQLVLTMHDPDVPKNLMNQAILGRGITYPTEVFGYSLDQVGYLAWMARMMINYHLNYRGTTRVRYDLFGKLQALGLTYHRGRPQGDAIYCGRRGRVDGIERDGEGRLHRPVPARSRAPLLLPPLRGRHSADGEDLQGSRGGRGRHQRAHPRAGGADGTVRENQKISW